MNPIDALSRKFGLIWPMLDERTRRLMAASEAMDLGYGGISMVRRACGLSRKAIATGIQEIKDGSCAPAGRIRRAGAGRKRITDRDPGILNALDRLIDPVCPATIRIPRRRQLKTRS